MSATIFADTAKSVLDYYFPTEITELILEKYICPRGIVMFQRKIRNYLSLKRLGWSCHQCEDCQHYFWIPPGADKYYGTVDACSDGNFCCWKSKCPWNCVYKCSECTKSIVSGHYCWVDSITCEHCQTEMNPDCVWYGLSPEAYRERYG